MKASILRVAAVLVLLLGGAHAQQLALTETDTTVGTAASQCVPAGPKKSLVIWNLHASNTVFYSVNNQTPVATGGVTGSIPILPGTGHFWPTGSAPSAAIKCISTGASTPVTAFAGY